VNVSRDYLDQNGVTYFISSLWWLSTVLKFKIAPLFISCITEQSVYLETLLTIILFIVLIFSGYVSSSVLCVFWELYHATRRWRAVINLWAAGWLGCRSVIAACAQGSAYPFTSYNRE